ncbi:MAG TPA: hypothetical protein VLA75_06320 [Thermoanaerobaculia bacterium]|nr:hypothetical protein [Thermoanaerobaculia bacterium]
MGATGRNLGKTELACRIVARHAGRAPVAALKVTTVVHDDGSCPRGGEGCGVCSSFGESWCVMRELDATSDKDTSRLLASGARASYWLRVREGDLAAGARGLLAHVPAGWVSVCESNRLARVVEPGLFLQVRSAGERTVKPSAQAVAGLVDRVVVSDGEGFDLDLERISLCDGVWALRRDACAVVVDAEDAPSGRMAESLLASLRAQFTQVETTALVDAPGEGRRWLSALAAALPRSHHDWCLVTPPRGGALPAPLVNALFRRREGVEAVVARERPDTASFRVGLFHRRLLARVVAALDGSPSHIAALAALGKVRELDWAPAAAPEPGG